MLCYTMIPLWAWHRIKGELQFYTYALLRSCWLTWTSYPTMISLSLVTGDQLTVYLKHQLFSADKTLHYNNWCCFKITATKILSDLQCVAQFGWINFVAVYADKLSGIASKGPTGSSRISGSCGTVLFSYSALAVLFLRCITFRNIRKSFSRPK